MTLCGLQGVHCWTVFGYFLVQLSTHNNFRLAAAVPWNGVEIIATPNLALSENFMLYKDRLQFLLVPELLLEQLVFCKMASSRQILSHCVHFVNCDHSSLATHTLDKRVKLPSLPEGYKVPCTTNNRKLSKAALLASQTLSKLSQLFLRSPLTLSEVRVRSVGA